MNADRLAVAPIAAAPLLALLAVGGLPSGLRPVPPRLLPGQTVEGGITAAETHRYRFKLRPGHLLQITLEQRDVDLVLVVEEEGGGLALRLDSPSGRRGRETALVAAGLSSDPVGGSWSVAVEAAPGAGQGGYRLEAREIPAAPGPSPWLEAEQAWTRASAAYAGAGSEDRREALRQLEAALPSFPSATSPRRSAEALSLAAELARAEGDHERARTLVEAALHRWRAAGDSAGEARALTALGFGAWHAGRVDEALDSYRASLKLVRVDGDRHAEAQVLNNLGHAHLYRGEPADAEDYFLQSLEAAREARAPRLEAAVRNNLGGVHQILGELTEARLDFEGARRLYAALGERAEEARAISNLGAVHRVLGDYGRALEHFLSARERFVQAGDRAGEATALNSIGAAYLALGETARAEAFFLQALPLRRAAGDRRGEAATLHNLGRSAQAAGRTEAAREAYARALELRRDLSDPRGEATTLDHLGTLELDSGPGQAALAAFRRALELRRRLGDRRLEARSLRHLGEALIAAGRAEEATIVLTEALALPRDAAEEVERVATLHARARAALLLGRTDGLEKDLREALELLETAGPTLPDPDLEASFRSGHRKAYELAVEVAMSRHRAAPEAGHHLRALELSERARARGLLAWLAEAGVEIRRGVDPELLARRRLLTERVAGKAAARRHLVGRGGEGSLPERLETEILDLLVQLEVLEGEVRRQSPAYADLRRSPPRSAGELQRLLDPDTVLLEYFLGDEASYLWAVTREEVTVHPLPPRRQVEEACRRLHESWSRLEVGRASGDAGAGDLADMLLGPVADRLGQRRLAVIADGALHYLPFAALPRPGAEPRSGDPLVLSHEVVHLPSATVLAELRRRGHTPDAPTGFQGGILAVLADPASAPTGTVSAALWPDLPWSRREAEAIVALGPPGATLLALGTEASREMVTAGRLRGFRFVHFGTHGVLDSEHPPLSGLMLASVDGQGRPREGFLGLHDIYNLDLAAELVVLSGCRTALGKEMRGEGMVGLARGFLSAGGERVVASLWPVQDRATAELMMAFYRFLLAERRPPAAALRAAQLEVRRHLRWRDPYFWAGFILVGDWEGAG